MDPIEWYYRFFDAHYAPPFDEFDQPMHLSSHRAIRLDRFEVVRRTPKGAWIGVGVGIHSATGVKFILDDATRRWALPTEAEALESYHRRKTRQASIYAARLGDAEVLRDAAKWHIEHAGHSIVDSYGIRIERTWPT